MEAVEKTLRKFLNYALNEIDFEYGQLTPTEQALCSPEEFKQMVEWIKKDGDME